MPPHDWKAKTGISTVAERVEKKYKKRKDSAGSDDTASMIKV